MADELFSIASIPATIADKSLTFYVSALGRPGTLAFSGFVEYTFFHPRFGSNSDEFHYYVFNFGTLHMMFGVPQQYETRVNDIARKLRLRPEFAVPILIQVDGTVLRLPGADIAAQGRRNFFVLEGNTDSLHFSTLDREKAIVNVLDTRGPVITPEQAAEYIWKGQE